jgi:hypothetical protein
MFIYLIVNHITGKYYVGQHKGKSLQKYLVAKFWDARHQRNGRSYLYNSMRKHPDPSVWSIHALLSDIQTKTELDKYEKEFIKFLRSRDPEYGYNICKGGEGFTGPGFRGPRTEEWKQKIRKTMKERNIKPRLRWSSLKDMTGQIINGIEILRRLENNKEEDAIWFCQCFCGRTFTAVGSCLRSGHTRSCGCLKIQQNEQNLSHGSEAGLKKMRDDPQEFSRRVKMGMRRAKAARERSKQNYLSQSQGAA